ncbi:MAG: TetR/AcrR family transcriptional regulator [Kofleriaceae bacterium]
MRRSILVAAAAELAEVGFEKATLSSIASRSGTSIGNLYKYFANKDQLFQAAIPPETSRTLDALLRARVEALHGERDRRALRPSHPYEQASAELFTFALAHRTQIIFLLDRAQGTPYASFAEELVQSLTELATKYFARSYGGSKLSASRRRALVRVYRAFLASLCAILREEPTEQALREATDHFTTYHLAGLKAFFEEAAPASRRPHAGT